MQKIYWLEYVNANHYNENAEGLRQYRLITETFWTKSERNSRRYWLKHNESDAYQEHGIGFDLVDLD